MERITLTLRGPDGHTRTFVSAQDTTLEHDVWMMPHVHAAGLHNTKGDPNAVLQLALSSGRVFLLLAGSVLEQGVPWSAQATEANAAWFASLTDRESKAQIHSALVQLLLSFFGIGTALSTISRSSSAATANLPNRAESDGSVPAPPVPSLQRETTSIGTPAVAISSASGDTSSSSSLAVTPSA